MRRPDTAVGAFARQLRDLRAAAGNPTYRQMAGRAFYSAGTLAAAARGEQWPSLPVVRAFAEACDADPDEWERRWHEATGSTANPPPAAEPERPAAPPIPVRVRRHLPGWPLALLVGAVAAVVVIGVLRWVAPPGDGAAAVTTSAQPGLRSAEDRVDPRDAAGCLNGAVILDHLPVELPPGTVSGVPGGVPAGELELRRGGPGCPATWSRFVPDPHLPAGMTITVRLDRPADHRSTMFSYRNDGKAVFSDMLRVETACTTASVQLGDPSRPVAGSTTRCLGDSH